KANELSISFNSKLFFPFGGHHLRRPGRIPHHPHIRFCHPRQGFNLVLRIPSNGWSHTTPLSGKGHLHQNLITATGKRFDPHVVNQSKIDHINGNLGVIDLPELVPDHFLAYSPVSLRRRCGWKAFTLFPERISILVSNTIQTS